MNLQALMKQAQSMQKNMLEKQKEIEKMTFTGKSELVEVTMNGKKQITNVKIKNDSTIEKDEIEILEDMIQLAVDDAISKVEKEIENKMGSQLGPLSGLM